MDDHFIGVTNKIIKKNKNKAAKRVGKDKKGGLKVVYISSPMKFKTCASKFLALVQELTGKDSDAAQFMDPVETEASSPTGRTLTVVDDYSEDHGLGFDEQDLMALNYDQQESPTCTSDSVFDHESLVLPEGSFLDMFTSSLFNESSHLDFLIAN